MLDGAKAARLRDLDKMAEMGGGVRSSVPILSGRARSGTGSLQRADTAELARSKTAALGPGRRRRIARYRNDTILLHGSGDSAGNADVQFLDRVAVVSGN